ncbi:MAG: lipid A phosphoethanolamine transferase [Duncaniella sp.]|nr:lipid A phosphoethanolamine transferase [Duncaniella sp.]
MIQKILFYIFIISLIIPNIWLSIVEPMDVFATITNVILPFGVIYLLMSLSRHIGKSIWLMFPFVFLAAFQIVLLSLYGRSVIAVDMFLNIVTTNSAEVLELLNNMLPVLGLVFVIYLPPLILGIIYIKRRILLSGSFIRKNRTIAVGMTGIGTFMLGLCYCSQTGNDYSVKLNLFPVNAIYNVYLACDRTIKTSNYANTSAGYKFGAIATHERKERELYLLVIGETSRAVNWQMTGYKRETNPRLSHQKGILYAKHAMSESNTTHKSVPMLLSTVDATTFDKEIYRSKSVITAFKEAGFATAFISNQRYNHSFIDCYGFESDTVVFIRENSSSLLQAQCCYDDELLPVLDNIISAENKKQLIVLHTYGSHFNYRDRYRDTMANFKPDNYSEAMKNERDRLINAYDNTIVATDYFLSECIARLDSIEGLTGGLLYTSDHGEDIFDNGSSRFLHASPLPTVYQLHVPMIGWMTDRYREVYPSQWTAACMNFNKEISTSRSFCPTAMQMAGIETEKCDTTASIMSTKYRPRKAPLYLSDHNTPVLLSDIILR